MSLKFGNISWLLSPKYRWLQHLLFWITLYFPHILSLVGISNKLESEKIYIYCFMLASNTLLVYFNIYFLVPEFFAKGRVRDYFAISAFVMVLTAFVNSTFLGSLHFGAGLEWPDIQKLAESFMFSFSLLMTALAFHVIKRFMVSQTKLKHIESAQLQTELNFLKSQINPHFLFNALNNIYVLSNSNLEEAKKSILHLSELLRYQLYDSAKDKVNLQEEIRFMQNFLRINEMRTDNSSIEFDVQGDTEGVKISPYLFIPFVENAVKHSRGLGKHKVRIKMIVNRQEVFFEIENSKPKVSAPKKNEGGIGLVNISRRLDLLYPGRYQLEISSAYNAYLVRMKLKLA